MTRRLSTPAIIARGKELVRDMARVFPSLGTDATKRTDALSPCPKCGSETVTEKTDDGCPDDVYPGPKFWWVRYCPECCHSERVENAGKDD